MSDLKLCPFCGGAGYLGCTGSPRSKRGWYPTCVTPNCPAVTDEQDEQGGTHFDNWAKAEAIAAWNTRADTAKDVASDLIERLLKVEGSTRPNNPLAVGTNWYPNPAERRMTMDWTEAEATAALETRPTDPLQLAVEVRAWLYERGHAGHVHKTRLRDSGLHYYGECWTETPLYMFSIKEATDAD